MIFWQVGAFATAGAGRSFVFTILIKSVTLPLTLKQLQSAKATQDLQPKLAELQQKYGKDKQKLSEEQMKLYKEAGVNPLGGCLPLLIQMPILFALYRAFVLQSDHSDPAAVTCRAPASYWIPNLAFPTLKPMASKLDLARPVPVATGAMLFAYFSLPVLMLISQLLLQKMAQPAEAPKAPRQATRTQMMGQMMMFMPSFLWLHHTGPACGLDALLVNVEHLSVVQQYFVTGWGGWATWFPS